MKLLKKYLTYSLLIGVLCITALFPVQNARAEAGDWFDGRQLQVSVANTPPDDQVCDEQIDIVAIGPSTACVIKGKNVDVATLFQGGGIRGAAVHVHGEDGYRRLIIDDLTSLLSAENDTFIYKERVSLFGWRLVAVHDLASSLRPFYVDDNGVTQSYFIDQGAQMALMPNDDGYHTVSSYVLSRDGKYAAAYIDDMGFVKIELTSGVVTKIFYEKSSPGYRPRVSAISDNGDFVLTYTNFIVNTIGCGDSFATPFIERVPLVHICATKYIETEVQPSVGFQFVPVNARFTDDGYGIEFDPQLDTDGIIPPGVDFTVYRHVTIHPYDRTQDYIERLDYLALGDSYSSGEGDIDDWPTNHYILNTEESGGCHLSSRSYPYLLRDIWGIDRSAMRSIACSGARVQPDYYGDTAYYGQNNQLASKEVGEQTEAHIDALNEFNPGVVRQVDFVSKYKPKKLTFTGGGNDIGFAQILGYCAGVSASPDENTCIYARDKQARADLNRRIDEQYLYNKQFIEKIKELSPETNIYMIGYPQFISDGMLCSEYNSLLNEFERKMIRESVSRLNNILKKVARDTGIYYIDIENALEGGEICDGSLYISGPLRVAVRKLTLRDSNMYHPNDKGHAKIAAAIAREIDNGNLDYQIIDIPNETEGRKTIRMAVMPNYAGIGSTYSIDVGPGTYKGDIWVDNAGFSREVYLGSAKTDHDGSLHTKITIPASIGPGYHLFTLTGIDDNDEPVVVQQFVTVVSGIPGDDDGDGIPNEFDECFAVSEWYVDGMDVCASPKVTDASVASTVLDTNNNKSFLIASNSNQPFLQTPGKTSIKGENTARYTKNLKTNATNDTKSTLLWILLASGVLALGYIIKIYVRTVRSRQSGP